MTGITEVFGSKGSITYAQLAQLAESQGFSDKPVSVELRDWNYDTDNETYVAEEYNPVAVILYDGKFPTVVIGDISAQDLQAEIPEPEVDKDAELEESEINETTTLSDHVAGADRVETKGEHEHVWLDSAQSAFTDSGARFWVHYCATCPDGRKVVSA